METRDIGTNIRVEATKHETKVFIKSGGAFIYKGTIFHEHFLTDEEIENWLEKTQAAITYSMEKTK
jgi:hypothetical protein